MEGWGELFTEDAPTEDTLHAEGRQLMGKILVISVDVYVGAQKHVTELLEGLDNREELFLDGSIVLLSIIEFA